MLGGGGKGRTYYERKKGLPNFSRTLERTELEMLNHNRGEVGWSERKGIRTVQAVRVGAQEAGPLSCIPSETV